VTVEFTTGHPQSRAHAPTIIAIHGLGDTAHNFSRVFRHSAIDAHWIIPQAPTPYGRGFSWFPVRVPLDPEQDVAPGVDLAAQDISRLIDFLKSTRGLKGPLVVTGFSQGGVISYAIAVGNFSLIDAAIPVAGALPLNTQIVRKNVPIIAIHGQADQVVPLALSEVSVSRIRSHGGRARLVSVPGVGHRMPRVIRHQVIDAIQNSSQMGTP